MSTCFDPLALTEPHRCPGRCACYVNHFCNPGCACTSCTHGRAAHIQALREWQKAYPPPLAPAPVEEDAASVSGRAPPDASRRRGPQRRAPNG
jgi:hypothetical protein